MTRGVILIFPGGFRVSTCDAREVRGELMNELRQKPQSRADEAYG